jgi:hypothetical protein
MERGKGQSPLAPFVLPRRPLPLTPIFDKVTRMPAPVKKSPSELQNQENEVYKALRAWYMIPGIQRELRHKENEAVQTVLEVFESRKRNRKASEG